MSIVIYDILLKLYHLLIVSVSPFNSKARLWVQGRKGFFGQLQKRMYKNSAPVIWFHSASLGEFEQSRPLIEALKQEYPQYNIFLTFFSPSGYEIRKNYELADYVFYLPLDTAFNAKKFIRIVNPKIAFFAKYEFWYHYISELHKNKIPIISFSSIFRRDQIFFKSYGGFYRELLAKINKIFVQNEESLLLLNEIKISSKEFAGDTRFDRVKEICDNIQPLPIIEKFKQNEHLFIIGSSWEDDLDALIEIINNPSRKLKTIVAPHEINERKISSFEQALKKPFTRYSQCNINTISEFDILIIDNIGMLSALYQYGDIAYIGGAFGKGLHNILEPATFGIPILFGPKYEKFQEAKDLVHLKSAFSINNAEEASKTFNYLYNDISARKAISEKTKKYIDSNIGATEKIMNYCKQFLN
jgi:3-deoxy-D-manno-octulosonic-acid transferase